MFKCFAFYTNSSHKRYKETNSPTVFKRPFRQKSAEKVTLQRWSLNTVCTWLLLQMNALLPTECYF